MWKNAVLSIYFYRCTVMDSMSIVWIAKHSQIEDWRSKKTIEYLNRKRQQTHYKKRIQLKSSVNIVVQCKANTKKNLHNGSKCACARRFMSFNQCCVIECDAISGNLVDSINSITAFNIYCNYKLNAIFFSFRIHFAHKQ